MIVGLEYRYMCTMEGKYLYVHGVAHLDRIRNERFPYKWTYAITESYMQQLIDDKKFNVIWYQKEFCFDF